MARITRSYAFLGQAILNPVRFVPVVPYGVEFTASGKPSIEQGSWFRLDLVLRIRPGAVRDEPPVTDDFDTDFPVRLAMALGSIERFRCPQMRAANDPPGAITGNAEAGESVIEVSGIGRKPLTPNRVVKFDNHDGVYLVAATPSPTAERFSVFPRLDMTVPRGTAIHHLDSDDALEYTGVLEGGIDLSAAIGRRGRMEAYSIRLHEAR